MQFKTEKIIGILLITGAVLVLIPYTMLIWRFNYPDILRKETGTILLEFHKGGSSLVYTWLAFALVGLPLLKAVVLIGHKFENTFYYVKWATTLGIIGFLVQIIGLLRWVFVVPVLADSYVTGNEVTKTAAVISFKTIHQFGGVLLGEHLGQLFTIAWTIMLSSAFLQLKLFSKWISIFGIFASLLYLLAQTELLATVIPNFPSISWAGFIGSTLWLLFLIVLGIKFLNLKMLFIIFE